MQSPISTRAAARPRRFRSGYYVAIPPFRTVDNTADVLRAQLYMNDERAPWGCGIED